jgi:hypothetical protein
VSNGDDTDPRPPALRRCISCSEWIYSGTPTTEDGWQHATCAALPAPTTEPVPPKPEATHRCKVCGAHWRLNGPTKVQPGGSWSLVYPFQAGKCCDNVAMASQIEAINPVRCVHCGEEIRPDGACWMDAETHTTCDREDVDQPHEPVSGEPEGEVPPRKRDG